tara:strand:- start:4250 stop:5287 length:1038 start_codon:yes stop_codon:yes gene_type:complete
MKWFVGTYSKRNSDGIYLIDFDESNGKFELINSFGEQSPSNPSFLATDIDNKYLYSVGESGSPNPGVVVSYSINNNNLEKINEEFTNGDNPCHLAVNSKNDYLVAVNYSSGDFSTYSLDQGKISFIEKISHEGSSINTERQNEPHAHSINFLDDDTFFVCDLGIDKIIKYTLDQQSKKIKSSKEISTTPGSGPRHFVINKNDKLAYSINELDSTITSFRIDEKNDISSFQNISTIPLDYTLETTTADLHFSLENKFLYGSNRGHDSIAQFEVKTDGSLKFLNHFSTLGKTPRNFGISNSNKFALVANENSDTIYSFYINQINGSFEPTGNKIEIPSPVCLLEIFK